MVNKKVSQEEIMDNYYQIRMDVKAIINLSPLFGINHLLVRLSH